MESLQPAMCCLALISGGGGSHGEAEHVGRLCVHWASLRCHWWVGLRVGIIEYVHNGRYEQPFLLAGIRLLSHAAHRLEAEDGERWV